MIYIFFRKHPQSNEEMWYPIEGIEKEEQIQDHVDLNPGTLRVEDIDGNVVWPKQTH